MLDINWTETISEAYQLGQNLEVLSDITLEQFTHDLHIEEIKKAAIDTRANYLHTRELYQQYGASEEFLQYFQYYLENYEYYALGESIIEIAKTKNLAFEVDWKCDASDFILAVKEVLPSLPDGIIDERTPFEYLYELINKINKEYLDTNTDNTFISYRILGDSYGFFLIPKNKVDKLIQNKFISFII